MIKDSVTFLGHELPVHAAGIIQYEHDIGGGRSGGGLHGFLADLHTLDLSVAKLSQNNNAQNNQPCFYEPVMAP